MKAGNTGSARVAFLAGGAVVLAAALGLAIAGSGPRAAALAPGIIAGAVVLAKPVMGLLAVLFTVPLEAAVMVPGGATLSKAVAALVCLAWVAYKLIHRESWMAVLGSPLFLAATAFLAFAAISRVWATYLVGFNSSWARMFLLFGLGVLTMDLIRSWSHAAWMSKALVLGGLVAAILTLVQYFGLGARRAGGEIAGGINATAIVLVTLMPFAFCLIRSPEKGLWRILGVGFVTFGTAAVAVTFSRMSYLVLGLILALELGYTLRSRRGRLAVGMLLLLGIPAFLHFMPLEPLIDRARTILPYIESTFVGGEDGIYQVSGRGYHHRVAMSIFRDHPVFGAGFDNYGRLFLTYQYEVPGSSYLYRSPRSAHSTFFAILADLGLVGVVLWVAFLGCAVVNLRTAWSRCGGRKEAVEFLIVRSVVLAFLAQMLYGFYSDLHYMKLFWLLAGLTVALQRLSLGQEPDPGDVIRRVGPTIK